MSEEKSVLLCTPIVVPDHQCVNCGGWDTLHAAGGDPKHPACQTPGCDCRDFVRGEAMVSFDMHERNDIVRAMSGYELTSERFVELVKKIDAMTPAVAEFDRETYRRGLDGLHACAKCRAENCRDHFCDCECHSDD